MRAGVARPHRFPSRRRSHLICAGPRWKLGCTSGSPLLRTGCTCISQYRPAIEVGGGGAVVMTFLTGDERQHHEQLSSVVRYYDGTWFDYRWLWLNSENNAIHFGYHDGRRRSHADSLLNTNRVLADIAPVGPGDRVLDAGCGIGGSSMWLAQQRGATVVGITPVRTQ